MRCILFFLIFLTAFSVKMSAREGFRVVFYNVENYFDCTHDSLKNDEEFLPGGIRGWVPTRFWKKAGQIAKVAAAVGEDRFPEVIGLAEVENENCIKSLIRGSPLKAANYSYIHEESPDPRGVDVCLLYNRYRFMVLRHEAIRVVFKGEPSKKTRDVLYVSGKTSSQDTLHIFVCHFPSRVGGELESESYRRTVARLIRTKSDSLFTLQKDAKILIMGDFNDYPTDRSLVKDLRAGRVDSQSKPTDFCNLMLPMSGNPESGTNKHQAEWGILDQLLVSKHLLEKTKSAHIFDADFLLESDERRLGRKPFRTYYGMVYQGGFSDHLPVYVDFDF